MDMAERIEKVREAQELLLEAIDLIAEAVKETQYESHTKAYMIDHLKIMASSDHGFLTRDLNLDELINGLEDPDSEGLNIP